jgi:hypothetical protein
VAAAAAGRATAPAAAGSLLHSGRRHRHGLGAPATRRGGCVRADRDGACASRTRPGHRQGAGRPAAHRGDEIGAGARVWTVADMALAPVEPGASPARAAFPAARAGSRALSPKAHGNDRGRARRGPDFPRQEARSAYMRRCYRQLVILFPRRAQQTCLRMQPAPTVREPAGRTSHVALRGGGERPDFRRRRPRKSTVRGGAPSRRRAEYRAPACPLGPGGRRPIGAPCRGGGGGLLTWARDGACPRSPSRAQRDAYSKR